MTGHDRITVDPAVLAGKPPVRGLRISVEHVFRALSSGVPEAELLADYPDLTADDPRACFAYAADLISTERVFAVPTVREVLSRRYSSGHTDTAERHNEPC